MRVCYLRTTERGGRAEGLRLVGAHTDDDWLAPGAPGDEVSRDGADWIRERLSAGGNGKSLGGLVVDVDGGACSWLGSPSADRGVVRAMLEGDGWSSDDGATGGNAGAPARFPGLPGELEVEPLSGAASESRLGVIATPGVPARELIDALDKRGVGVGWVCSLWHAVGEVWGAGEASGGHASGRVIADQRGLTAAVVVDAQRGRALWVWRDGGEGGEGGGIVAAGSMRYDTVGGFDSEDAGRLTLDWLGWGAQLGRAPSLVRCVAAQGDGEPLASAVADRWPSASVDLVESDDPVLETVRGLAQDGGAARVASGASALGELSVRPGRAHRSMHVWAALAMAIGGGALGLVAKGWLDEASDVRTERAKIEANRRDILEETGLPPNEWKNARMRMRERIEATRGVEPETTHLPVLEEFETLTYVIANPDWSLQELSLRQAACTVKLVVPNVAASEGLEEAFGQITDRLEWTRPTLNERANGVECTFTAAWSADAASGGAP